MARVEGSPSPYTERRRLNRERSRRRHNQRQRGKSESEDNSRSRDRGRSRSGDRRRRQRSPSSSSGTPSDSDRGGWPSGSESGSDPGWAGSDEEEREQTPGEGDKQGMDRQQEATPEKDSFGPSLSKDEMKVLLGGAKRVDDKAVTLTINPALIDAFSKNLMGGGKWNGQTWDDMEDKYRLSKEQQAKLDPPTLKGTKLFAAMRDKERTWDKKYMLCHINHRHLVKLGLRQYELFMVAEKAVEAWTPPTVYEEDDTLSKEFQLAVVGDFKVEF